MPEYNRQLLDLVRDECARCEKEEGITLQLVDDLDLFVRPASGFQDVYYLYLVTPVRAAGPNWYVQIELPGFLLKGPQERLIEALRNQIRVKCEQLGHMMKEQGAHA